MFSHLPRRSLLIVVPTLDSYKLLPRLVLSLQGQTWPFWRVLFIDGPSGQKHRSWLESCCRNDKRFSWIVQDPAHIGIFGAMNQGFENAEPEDWLLFWGSDDWAASPEILEKSMSFIDSEDDAQGIDLLICSGRYVDSSTELLGRISKFSSSGSLSAIGYRRTLWFGSTPPHQATFFGPRARSKLSVYEPGLYLSADLAYFLALRGFADLSVQCLDLQIVYMAVGGVSSQRTLRRLYEVFLAYRHAYGWLWFFPFLARYYRRLVSAASFL